MNASSDTPSSELPVPTSNAPLRLLVVEDSPRDSELAVREIRRGGFDVTWKRVDTAEAMRAALDAEPWEAIIADYRMPHFDGLAALRVLHEHGIDIPFILVSGTIGEDAAVAAMKEGAHDYLMKDNLVRLVPALVRELRDAGIRRERQRVEVALTASEVRYRRLFESAKDGILILDAETGMVVDVNPFLVELLGYTHKEFLGKRVWELGFLKSIVANQDNFVELQQKEYLRYEDLPLETHDGRQIDVEFVSNVYLVDTYKVIQCNIRDISKRRQAESAVRASEDRFRRAIVDAPFPIMIHAEDGEVLQVSNSWCEITGYTREELATIADWTERAYGERKTLVRADIDALYGMDHRKYEGDYTVRTKSGDSRIWEFSSAPLGRLPEGRRLVVSMALDVTERRRSEEDIRKLALMVDTAPNSITVHDFDGRYLYANQSTFAMHGYSRDEFLAINLHQMDVPASEDLIAARMKGLRERAEASFEVEHFRKDGTILPLDISAKVTTWDGKKVILSIGTDITERKRAEAAVAREQALSNAIIDSIPGTFYMLDEKGEYVRWNAYQRDEIIGKPEDQVAGTNALDTIHPDDRALIQMKITSVLKSGKEQTVEGRVLLCGGPAFRWLLMTGRMMTIEGRSFLVGTGIDITEHKRVEEAFRQSEANFRAMADASPLVIYLSAGADQVCEYLNPTFSELLGYTLEDVPTVQEWWPLAYPDEEYRQQVAHEWNEKVRRAIESQTSIEPMETIVTCKDGSKKNIRWGCIALDEKSYAYGLDLTESKRAEREKGTLLSQLAQAQKMESVGRLAGGVAHDFNNMLMGIMNYAELCRDKLEPDHPIREWLNEITVDAERSSKLTHQLLAFARKQIIAPKVIDINDAIAGMLKLLRRLIGEDITMKFTADPDTWPVKMDPVQIDQILANLCVNARDAIGGVGSISIETSNTTFGAVYCADHAEALPGDYTLLTVIDSGGGMDKETLENIFEPFFTTKGVGEGTGLGLATVYGIVKQNNGFINVHSEPGQGTTFKIYLPRHVAAEAPAAAAKAPKPTPRGNETVLLVEDEKSIRITTQIFLEDLGYTVLVAEDPQTALRLVAEHPGEIPLLITDVIMPGMSGRDLANRLLELRPAIKRLFISGFTADVIAQRGILDDGVNFLSKPFGRDTLAHKVREVLEEREKT